MASFDNSEFSNAESSALAHEEVVATPSIPQARVLVTTCTECGQAMRHAPGCSKDDKPNG